MAAELTDYSPPPGNDGLLEHYASDLNKLTDCLSALGSLTLAESRRAAFAIAAEDIADEAVRRTLQHFYAPATSDPLCRRLRILDGGITTQRS